MGRKRNLPNMDEYELGYIEAKMNSRQSLIIDEQDNFQLKRHMYKIDLKCKNKKQKEFLQMLKDPKHEICFGIGSAGSGKSYLSLGFALSQLKDPSTPYEKIIILVPTCEAGAMSLGFLKGTLLEKIGPYLEADSYTMEKILNNSGNANSKQILGNLLNNGYINYEVVNFARGKTFDNSLILLNEAENYSKEEMLLLLTRIGENSKLIITGDLKQLDRKDIKKSKVDCGLEYAVKQLGDMDETGVVEFHDEDIVRNPLITKILNNWY